MEIIENGKDFQEVLSLDELERIQGGLFCIKVKWCEAPDSKGNNSCGIVMGCKTFEDT